MQILLLQDRLDVREKVAFFIESTYGAKVHEASSVKEGTDLLLKPDFKVDFIVLDSKKGQATPEMQKKFLDAAGQTSILGCVQGIPEGLLTAKNLVAKVDRAALMDSLVTHMEDLVKKLGNEVVPAVDQFQVRIRTKLLLSVGPLQGDIYIQLGKDKFVKLFQMGDVFDAADLERYTVKKGVEYLFIRKEQSLEFATKYRDELKKMLLSENLTVEDVTKLGEAVHETVQELSKQVGFTKEVQEMTKAQVQLTVKSMGKDPGLSEVLKKLMSQEGEYIASHSSICSYLSCAIAAQLKWGSETTFYKLSLACFLHDITLENQTLAAIGSLEELEKVKGNYTEAEIKEYREHPMAAADYAKKMTEVPPDVDTIIRQHHEKPDGTGFPRKLTHAYIAPLAAVFIVAHDLTRYAMQVGDEFNPQIFVDQVKDLYKQSQFKKVLACLETLQTIKRISATINAKPPA